MGSTKICLGIIKHILGKKMGNPREKEKKKKKEKSRQLFCIASNKKPQIGNWPKTPKENRLDQWIILILNSPVG
jgi:hypothetical protein